MILWLLMIPLIAALIGWFLTWIIIKMLFQPHVPVKFAGFLIQGLLPKQQPILSSHIGKLVSEQLVSFNEIEQKILDPATLQRITPEIEMHIDHFLRVKLKDAIPMVAMFVGDKTIIQLKEVFMTEMETLFPDIMKSYVRELQQNLDFGKMVTAKLASLPASKIESFLLKTLAKEFRYVQVAGLIVGFIIGAIQVVITLLIHS